MSRKNLRNNFSKEIVVGVDVVDISEDGRGIGKKEGEVFFIKGAVPGEKLTIEVYGKKKSVKEAKILNIETSSPHRVDPFCKYFGECGGCKWQHLAYKSQLEFKEKQILDALTRIGKIDSTYLMDIWNPILPSLETKYYRNKLEFTFSHRRWKTASEITKSESNEFPLPPKPDVLDFEPPTSQKRDDGENLNSDASKITYSAGLGFHIPGSFDKILDIEYCFLQKEPSNLIRNAIKEFCIKINSSFFNLRSQSGLMRNLLIRTASTGELMVIVVFAFSEPETIQKLMNYILQSFPEINSLQYIINSKQNDTLHDREVILFSGVDHIKEKMENLVFRISAKSFYQTNSEQAYQLYNLVRKIADFKGDELVYDLYTGTGTIANFIADKVQKVIGLEYVDDAVLDAKKNAEFNQISNVEFFTGDIKNLLSESFTKIHGFPDTIITDPPRAGMHPEVVEAILKIEAKKLIYISCNPATQARDILMLNEKYELINVFPVDMFPHTQHVENIVLLGLRSREVN